MSTTDRVFFVALAVFLVLFGLFAVTNIKVEWGAQLVGFAALIAGIMAVVKLVRG